MEKNYERWVVQRREEIVNEKRERKRNETRLYNEGGSSSRIVLVVVGKMR